ncbi:DUF3325 domain-containing protein [Propionivibrio limicola]|uniref:DUF3325 domain-containing protein n=1 Tax=Propionivibrio limicola TaxID=167645 RepID=UPI00129109E9|nr:DUF3325 domain-containing protein [Propionivibrio limicola]
MSFLILASSFAGFGALCLSMERHGKQVIGSVPPLAFQLLASILGWGLLALALTLSVRNYGASVGITAWFGYLTLAAVAVGLSLTYAPRTLRHVAPALLVLAGVLAVLV